MKPRGKFITLEGIDGAGKSTHLAFIAESIAARGHTVRTTREPGGTPVGEKLRALLLAERMHGETEAMLMFASRRELMATVIEPALAAGEWVVCDRFTDSTYAYQCGGRGLARERVGVLEAWVHGDLQPDLTFLFDAPLDLARSRVAASSAEPDKFEREQEAFFAGVRAEYLARADRYARRFRIIDTRQDIAAIRAALAAHLAAL
ncbi:MAG TPA: dTMP kinase [Usitatibacteraceae bacterium]|nr:dTMP kinase [Usitatibacteraceae bacterium]